MRKKEESPLSINCRASTVRELNLMLSHRRNREERMGRREGRVLQNCRREKKEISFWREVPNAVSRNV